MAKSLSKVRRDSERRQHQRFMVPKGTLVIVSPGTYKEWKVQAIDISHGGLKATFSKCHFRLAL